MGVRTEIEWRQKSVFVLGWCPPSHLIFWISLWHPPPPTMMTVHFGAIYHHPWASAPGWKSPVSTTTTELWARLEDLPVSHGLLCWCVWQATDPKHELILGQSGSPDGTRLTADNPLLLPNQNKRAWVFSSCYWGQYWIASPSGF